MVVYRDPGSTPVLLDLQAPPPLLLDSSLCWTVPFLLKQLRHGLQESAMIREQSSATDPQQSAEYTTTILYSEP